MQQQECGYRWRESGEEERRVMIDRVNSAICVTLIIKNERNEKAQFNI